MYQTLGDVLLMKKIKDSTQEASFNEVNNLLRNIKNRGRDYETEIEESYLSLIQDGYFEFIKSRSDMTSVVLDMNNIDFVANAEDYQKVNRAIFETKYEPGMNMIIL